MSPALGGPAGGARPALPECGLRRAEEGVVQLLLMDSDFFRQAQKLKPEQFHSPVLGKVFSLLRTRWEQGQNCSLSALAADLTPEEMSLLAGYRSGR